MRAPQVGYARRKSAIGPAQGRPRTIDKTPSKRSREKPEARARDSATGEARGPSCCAATDCTRRMEKAETAEECAEAPAARRTEDQELRHHEGVDDDALRVDDQNDDDQNGNEEGGGAKSLGGETLQKVKEEAWKEEGDNDNVKREQSLQMKATSEQIRKVSNEGNLDAQTPVKKKATGNDDGNDDLLDDTLLLNRLHEARNGAKGNPRETLPRARSVDAKETALDTVRHKSQQDELGALETTPDKKQSHSGRRRSKSEVQQSWRARRKSGSGSGRKLKKAASKGELREVDGKSFEGIWEGDRIVGVGLMLDKHGEYEGEFNDALASEGKGTKSFTNGDWHTGMYEGGVFHGPGTYVYRNGDRFDGVFAHNQLASGIFRWIEGHVYAGAFRDGVPDGEGSKRLADGRQYKGAWRAGKAHGWGVRTYPNGDCHEGMYQNDKRHGFGRYRWHDGEQVDGFWVDGVLQGRARRVLANGDVVHCNARDNRFAGLGVRRSTGYRLGCYVGYLDEEGLPKGLGCANEIFQRSQRLLGPFGSARTVTGFGIKDFAPNTFYAGDMVNSIPHGLGIFQWQDKTIHRGRWRFGKQHGFGRTEYFVNSNRTVCVQGTWNNGSLDGECIAEVVTSDGKMWHFASRWILGEKVSSSPRREVFKSLLHSPMVQTIQAHGQAESAAQDSLDVEPNAAPQFPDDTLAHAMVPNFDPFGLMPDINPVLQLLLDDLF